jgi:hypothetical protein
MEPFHPLQFRIMSGVPLALIGYAVTYKSLMAYEQQYVIDSPRYSYRHIMEDLQSKLHIPLSLAIIENKKEVEHMICCFASSTDAYYDCSDLMELTVPEVFQKRIPQWFEVKSKLRRIFARKGTLYDYEIDGLDEELIAAVNRSTSELPAPKRGAYLLATIYLFIAYQQHNDRAKGIKSKTR